MPKTIDVDTLATQWIDRSYPEGRLLAPLLFFGGCLGLAISFIAIGIVLLADFANLFSYLITLFSGVVFLLGSIVLVFFARNLASRARVIEMHDRSYSVVFWWQGRRKNLEFRINDVERVEQCEQPKSIKQLLASLPREPICYWVVLEDRTRFQIAGKDEDIHEIVKRFSGEDS